MRAWAAVGVSLVLVAQTLIGTLVGLLPIYQSLQFGPGSVSRIIWGFISGTVLPDIAFGVGLWISLRFISRIQKDDGWKVVIRRGVIAALIGACAFVVFALLQILISSVTVSQYPFVNAVNPSLDVPSFGQELVTLVLSCVRNLFEWIPFSVLAVILLRIGLPSADNDEPVTDRASDAESLEVH